MKKILSILLVVGFVALVFSLGAVRAADVYPSRTIQVIVPFPPGGVADLVARPFSSVLEKELKQPVAVVNKTGAGGAVGMQSAAVARPDGYTLMVALSSISVMPEVDALFGRPSTYKLKDFAPIALLSADPTILVVKKESPWKTVADFVADAKKRPNEIKYSSSGGIRDHACGHGNVCPCRRDQAAPYSHRRGRAGPDLPSRRARGCPRRRSQCFHPPHQSGNPGVLAGWGDKRLNSLPDVPTFKELGYKDVEFYIWSGFFAPAATPPAAIKVLREVTAKAVQASDFKSAMEKMETPIYYLDAPEFQKFWDQDAERLIKAVRNIGKVQ